jgi:hypothetical protein
LLDNVNINSPVIFQILTNKIAEIYFRSLATENSSEYSTSENITDYSTSGRGEYFKQTLIIIFIQLLLSYEVNRTMKSCVMQICELALKIFILIIDLVP